MRKRVCLKLNVEKGEEGYLLKYLLGYIFLYILIYTYIYIYILGGGAVPSTGINDQKLICHKFN